MAHHAADGLDVAARLVVEGGGEEAPEGVHGDGDATPVPQGADGLGDAGGVHAVQSPLMVAVLEQVVVPPLPLLHFGCAVQLDLPHDDVGYGEGDHHPLVAVALAVDLESSISDIAVADVGHLGAAEPHVGAEAEDHPLAAVGVGVDGGEAPAADEHPVPGLPVVEEVGLLQDVPVGVVADHAGEASEIRSADALLDGEDPPQVEDVVGADVPGAHGTVVCGEGLQAPADVVAMCPQRSLLPAHDGQVAEPGVGLGHVLLYLGVDALGHPPAIGGWVLDGCD